ncbi:MAG TPA: hypothetical protein VF346_02920, partial [Bacteroidales bacterium]
NWLLNCGNVSFTTGGVWLQEEEKTNATRIRGRKHFFIGVVIIYLFIFPLTLAPFRLVYLTLNPSRLAGGT